jgi:putative ABC transport system ATP-binding protein
MPHVKTTDPILFELKQLVVGIDGAPLNRPLNLQLNSGQSIALLGPSGSGKTTLLRAAAGLIDPIEGQILLQSSPPSNIGWPEFRRRVILVDQQPVLLDTTLEENLARPFTYQSAGSKQFDRDEAVHLLEQLGIESNKLDQNALSLSVGEQQRACLVRAIQLQPQVLLMDEPTSALDEARVSAVEGFLRKHTEENGQAMLIVTHSSDQANRLCTSTLQLIQ